MNIRQFLPWFHGTLAVMLLLVAAHATPAHADDEEEQPVRISVKASIFRVELDETSRFGTEMTTREMEDLVAREGSSALGRTLEQSGPTVLASQAESEERAGSKMRFFAGGETPFLTTFMQGQSDGSIQTRSQQTVTTGSTIEIESRRLTSDLLEVDYSINHDLAFPTDSEGTTLIGRERYSTSGTTVVDSSGDVIVKRQVNTSLGKPVELILVIELETR